MTNREAIHILRGLKKYYKDYFDSIDNEAIDMAIMRLMEQEQDSVDYIRKEVRDKNMPNSLKCKIKHLRHNGTLTERECDRILKALEQQLCEDCISRKEVNVLVDELARAISDERRFLSRGRSTAAILQNILDLPSVTPKYTDEEIDRAQAVEQAYIDKMVELRVEELKRPTGHNCNEDYADCDQFVCSECGIELQDWHRVERDLDDGDVSYHEYTFRFCPNCGARMAESEGVE